MKYRNFKKVMFMIVFILVTFSCTDVHAGFWGTLKSGEMASIPGANLYRTHNMKVNIGGVWYDAYCAWYENDAPYSGKYYFEAVGISPQSAAGLTYILNDNVVTAGLTSDQTRVIKTMAVNVFLSSVSELAGKYPGTLNPTYDANRFDGKIGCDPNNKICEHKYNYWAMLPALLTGNVWEQKIYILVIFMLNK